MEWLERILWAFLIAATWLIDVHLRRGLRDDCDRWRRKAERNRKMVEWLAGELEQIMYGLDNRVSDNLPDRIYHESILVVVPEDKIDELPWRGLKAYWVAKDWLEAAADAGKEDGDGQKTL